MSSPRRGPFDVWAPRASRLRLSVGDAIVDMVRGDRRLVDARGRAAALSGGDRLRLPDRRLGHAPTRPAVAASAGGRPPALANPRRRAFAWTDQGWTGRQLAGSVIYELHVGTFTPEGTFDAALGRLDHLREHRRRLRRADAGQRLQRHPQLGLRRRALVRRARAVRRPGGLPAVRRRLPRGRPRRDPGRRPQPPRPVGELPARVRPLPQGGRQHLGRPGQPRRRGLGGGAALHPRQRPDVAGGLPRRRAAARRRARPRRRLRPAPARGAGGGGGRAVGAPAPAARR